MATPSHDVIYYLRSLLHRHSDAEESDRELLCRFVERCDDDAFTALLRRHGPMVLNLARRITSDKQLAEDVFQATFLLLSQKAGTIRRPEALPCWLHGVVRRLAVQTRSTQLRSQRQEALCRPSLPSNPLDELTAREFLAVLDEELAKLPENYRAPLILCCLEGLAQEEAARRLGCSAGAIRGRLERGRQRLRLRLEKRGLTLPAVFGGTLLVAGATSAVPEALAHATLQAAKPGSNVAPAVAALIHGAMRSMVFSKLKILAATAMLLALAGTGVGMMVLRPQTAKEKSLPAVADSTDKPVSLNKRVDLYGDPLPEGVALRLGTIQRRAVGARIAVSADGKSVLSLLAGKYLRIWDAATGQLREKRELPGDSFNSLAVFSRDGRLSAIHNASAAEVRIWDIEANKLIQTLSLRSRTAAQRGYLQSLTFAPDGEHIAALDHIDKNYRIRVWKTKSGNEVFRQEFEAGHGVTDRLMLAGVEKRLFALFLSRYTNFRCWDVAGGRQAWQHADIFPFAVVATPDDKILVSGQRSQAQAVDLATGRTIELKNPPPIDPYAQLSLTPDGRTLLVGDEKGVEIWDWQRGKKLRTLDRAGEEIVVLPDGNSIIANNGELQRWELATGKPLWADTFDWGHAGAVLSLAISADGKRLASGSADGTVRLWDATTGRPLRLWRGHAARRPIPLLNWEEAGVQSLDITPLGRWIFSAGSDDRLKLWDTAADKEVRALVTHKGELGMVIPLRYQVRINPDAHRAVALFGCFVDGQPQKCINKLAVWNPKTGEQLASHSIPLQSGACYSLSFDGGVARMGNVLVDTASGKETVRLPELRGDVGAISRDGALVAGIARDRSGMHICETATGKLIASLKQLRWTSQVAFHPDHRFLASNDLDGIRLWDVRSGKRVAQFRAPEPVRIGMASMDRYICCLAFTPEGQRVAAGMPDGTILFWDISLPPSKPQRLERKEIESLWADLADADAAKAWRAVWRLADAANDALALLRGRVKPYPTAAADLMRKLLADLDSDSFEAREAAVKRLKELGPKAEPALRAALQAKPSLEQRRRIEELLGAAPCPPNPEELRQLRALIVLERIGTPEARRLLEDVAKGPPSAPLTRQALASLACLP